MKTQNLNNKTLQIQMLIIREFEMYLIAVCLHGIQTAVYSFLLQCRVVHLGCV